MPYSVNFKTDVVDYDAGTNISADTVEELKQNITDFVQSGLLDYITHAALRAREAGRAAKNGTPAPQVTEQQAVQNVQQVFPQAQEIQEQSAPFVAPAPPVPQPSLPSGVEFEQQPDGKLKIVLPYLADKSKWKEANDAARAAGARAVKNADGSWANYKVVTPDKQADVARALASVLG